jgi:hypothetical protein
VYVIARTVAGAGLFTANGAAAGSTAAGGGAGGRIALYALDAGGFGFGRSTAIGGSGNAPGGSGSLLLVPTPPGDANCDGRISATDTTALLGFLGRGTRAHCGADDADENGSLGARDLAVITAALFGE